MLFSFLFDFSRITYEMYSAFTFVLILLLTVITAVIAHVERKGDCDLATDDLLCRYSCGPLQLQPMCVSGECYCTDVGTGSCKTGNNGEGCKTVCEFLSKSSTGCFEGQCSCH